MPWRIELGGGDCADSEYAVIKESDGSTAGCHATRADAEDQLAALYANEGSMASADPTGADELPLRGILATEGTWTGDGRYFDPGALRWDVEHMPMPFRWAEEDYGAHQGARHVGWIDTAERVGKDIVWTGRSFDPAFSQYMQRAGKCGVSIDCDDETYDVILPEDALDVEPEPGKAYPVLTEKAIFHDARIRAATGVDIPAFITGYVEISVVGEGGGEATPEAGPSPVSASAGATFEDIPGLMLDHTPAEPETITHAGLLLAAEDTGRWLMLQRALSDGDENGGLWEFPGGGIDPGEDPQTAALREFAEECGMSLPEEAVLRGAVDRDNYRLHVYSVPEENGYALDDREFINPDDPDGDMTEALAWWDPEHVRSGGYHIRPEVQMTDWDAIDGILRGTEEESTMTELADAPADAPADVPSEDVPAEAEPTPELTDADKAYLDSTLGHYQEMLTEATDFIDANPDSSILGGVQSHAEEITSEIDAIGMLMTPEAAPVEMDVLTASAAPLAPPDEWFEPFDLDGPTPMTITADGRVFGHLATWDSCHRSPSLMSRGECVKPPSDPDPSFFHLGQVITASGATLEVGALTVGGGHADVNKGLVAALEHYDDVSTVAASVRAHEDEYGIALFGSVDNAATPQQVAALRRAPLSGDWRKERGRLRLVAAHAVVTPGFPIPRGVVASVSPQSFLTNGRVKKCSDCGEEETDAAVESLVAATSVRALLAAKMEPALQEQRLRLVKRMEGAI